MAHVLIFPFPAQGHVPVMLKLAELLSRADDSILITFVNTEYVHARFANSSSDFERLAKLPNFRFRTIPDGLPEDDPRNMTNFVQVLAALKTAAREPYLDILLSNNDAKGWPKVTCVISSDMLAFAMDVADEVDIPAMVLRTSSACSGWASCCTQKLIDDGEVPFPEGGDLDVLLKGVTGMETFLRRRDISVLYRPVKTADDPTLKFMMSMSDKLTKARGVIINTIECLESTALSNLRTVNPLVYTIGPLQNLLKTFKHTDTGGKGVSLWEADRSCLDWLDSQPEKSVVYVSFGSLTTVSRETLLEFWFGLVNSGKRFLWVIRPDMVKGGGDVPAELEIATKERGCIVAWAPQEEVLAHQAVGSFLTHCGWNSTMESVIAGVPMICWPFFADQHINSRFVSEVWKLGVDMKDMVGREVVEGMVRKVMEGEEAEAIRRNAKEMSAKARAAVEEGGSSYSDFEKLVEFIKSLGS